MATSEERMRILKMIEEKQITAEEGAKLLEALRSTGGDAAQREAVTKARWLRVRVTDRSSGKLKVNVNIPVERDPDGDPGGHAGPNYRGRRRGGQRTRRGFCGMMLKVEGKRLPSTFNQTPSTGA
jgi:hypothetical protein